MKIRIANPFKFYCFIIVFVCFCTLFTSFFLPGVLGKSELQFEQVHINAGDTLWEIAQTYKPEHVKLHQFIREIKIHNGMDDAMLYEGTTLLIPMYSENL